jgi:hypothetical protein
MDHGNGLCCGTDLAQEAIQGAMGPIRTSMELESCYPRQEANDPTAASDSLG